MRASLLLTLVSLMASTASCATIRPSGVRVSESRTVGDFDEIEVSGGLTLEVRPGSPSLTIEGDSSFVPLYVTEVTGGRLRIFPADRWSSWGTRAVVVRVTVQPLRRLDASGGVDVVLDGPVVAPTFEAELSGGVELRARALQLDALALEASGGVRVLLAGQARTARFETSGGVEVRARDLLVSELELDASGGCDLELNARESIRGEASGGADLQVYGNPARSRVHTSGGADVEYRDHD